jgi:hypothetical protein
MGLTKVDYAMLKDGAISVKAYGAVGDGVEDDTAAIQAAINSAATSIYFPGGSYLFTSQVDLKSNLSIWSDSDAELILQSATPERIFVGEDVSNLTIRGLRFRQANATAQCYGILLYLTANVDQENIRILENDFKDFTLHCISLNGYNANDGQSTGPTNAGFRNVSIINNTAETTALLVQFYGASKHIDISGNFIVTTTANANAIELDNYASDATITNNDCYGLIICGGGNNNVVISNNKCSGIRTGFGTVTASLGGSGQPYVPCTNLIIADNIIDGTGFTSFGIDIAGSPGNSAGSNVNYSWMATSLTFATNITISGNIVKNVASSALSLTLCGSVEVVGNIFDSSAQYGALIVSSRNVNLLRNTFKECGATASYQSIRLSGDVTTQNEFVKLQKNTISNSAAAKNHEVFVESYSNDTIIDNNVIDVGSVNTSLFAIGFGATALRTILTKHEFVRNGTTGLLSIAAGATFVDGEIIFISPVFALNASIQPSIINTYTAGSNNPHNLIVTKMVFMYETNGAGGSSTTITLATPTSATMATVTPPAAGLRFDQIEVTPTVYLSKVGATEPLLYTVTPGGSPNTCNGRIVVYGVIV